jgi:hypothetical protein
LNCSFCNQNFDSYETLSSSSFHFFCFLVLSDEVLRDRRSNKMEFRMHMGTDGKLSFSNIRMTEQLECYLDTIIQPITIQNIDTIMTLSFLFRVYVALFR